MPNSIAQLIGFGAQDTYLTAIPQITFFRNKFKIGYEENEKEQEICSEEQEIISKENSEKEIEQNNIINVNNNVEDEIIEIIL